MLERQSGFLKVMNSFLNWNRVDFEKKIVCYKDEYTSTDKHTKNLACLNTYMCSQLKLCKTNIKFIV